MKIRKFRIKPRLSVVSRILKSILTTRQLPPEIEERLPRDIESFCQQIVPNAFYQTWPRDTIPYSIRTLLDSSGLSHAVAVSIMVSTIGSEPEDNLSQLLMKGATQQAQVSTAICEESADLSFQFLMKLLTIDAKSDDCDISEPIPVTDAALLQEALSLVEAQQEGVSLDSAMHLTPRFTRVGLVGWCPITKRKRSAALPKKKI